MIVATSLLFAANAAAMMPRLLSHVDAVFNVPRIDLSVGTFEGWVVVGIGLEPLTRQNSLFMLREFDFRKRFRSRNGGPPSRISFGVDWHRSSPITGQCLAFGIASWWLNIAFGSALLWIGIRAYRRGRDADACSACGYSLAGLAGSACPECGVARKEEASR